jgi:Protein of unknown function (DUF3631)/Domain of unknown function (DUF3854)
MSSDDLARQYLLGRGVLEETFSDHGGEIDPWMLRERISKRLNRDAARTMHDNRWIDVQAILWFPLRNTRGETTSGLARPLPHYDGQKFLCPNGSDGTPWIPGETFRARRDVELPLFITEGPVKGMALLQAGALPIALQGVWMAGNTTSKPRSDKRRSWDPTEEAEYWKREAEETEERYKLRPELSAFSLARRRVYIVFDADHLKNQHVRQAEIRLAFMLHAAGADVFQFSIWALKEGKGIDDYLALKAGTDPAEQRKELASLLDRAVPFLDTLDEHDIPAVKKELHRIEMDPAQFAALAKVLAKRVGTTKRALGAYEYDEGAREESKAINIPPTAPPWEGEVKAAAVLDEVCATLARFVWMKPSHYRAVALWIVLSYLHDAIDILPILTITSPDQECGKTTLLKVVFNLCNRPVSASNISAAAIYRIIGEDCPCLTLDEADSYMQEDEAMRGIINSGHERQMAFVLRVINDKGDVGRFPTWCPKAIAMIGLPRRTILSRSIHIRIERKDKGTKLEKLRRKHYAELEDLRRKISKLANDIRARVKAFESDDQLGNRAGDNWEPLFAIASAADEEWLAEAVAAAERMSGKDAHDAKSFNKYLLESLGRIIAAKREAELIESDARFFLRTQDLLTELNQDEEAPWKEKAKDELSANRLRNVLVSYGVKPIQVRTGQESKKPVRGYWSDELERVIKQYE